MSSKSLKDLKQEYASKNNFVESENTSILDLKRRYNAPNVAKDIKSRLEQWDKDRQSLLDGYNSRFFDKDGQYITNTFRSSEDAGNWLYDAETKREALEAETNSIKSLLTDYGEYFDENIVKDINNMLDGNTKTINSVVSNALIDKEYWDRFENETAWKDAKKLSELYSMTSAEIQPYLDAIAKTEEEKKAQISALNSERSAIKSKLQQHNRGNKQYNTPEKKKAAEDRVKAIDQHITFLEESESGIAYTTSSGQNITWQKLYDDKKAEEDVNALYDELSANDDWEEKSQYITTNLKGTPRSSSIIDPSVDWKYEDVNKYQPYFFGGGFALDWEYATFTTDKEKAVFNYLYHTQGKDAAFDWHNSRKGIYKDRQEAKAIKFAIKFAEDYPILSDAFAMAGSVFSGGEYIADLITGNAGDTNQIAAVSSAIKGTRMEQIDWEIGNWDAFDFLYSTTTSGLESAASSLVFGKLGGVALGLSAAAQGTNDALNRGMDNKQAFWNGFFNGVFEGFLKQYPLASSKHLKKVLLLALKILPKTLVNQCLLTHRKKHSPR